MLIETSYKKGDVVTVRLSSGEEIVARMQDETDTVLKLSKPMAAMMSEKGLALIPFILTVDPETDINLNKNQVMFVAKPVKEISDHYLQSTTGITLGI